MELEAFCSRCLRLQKDVLLSRVQERESGELECIVELVALEVHPGGAWILVCQEAENPPGANSLGKGRRFSSANRTEIPTNPTLKDKEPMIAAKKEAEKKAASKEELNALAKKVMKAKTKEERDILVKKYLKMKHAA